MTEYPEYTIWDEGDETCWSRYTKRIKEMQESDKEYTYPLNYNSQYFDQHGNDTGLDVDPRKCILIDDFDPKEFLGFARPKQHVRACSLDYLLDSYEYDKANLDPPFLIADLRSKTTPFGEIDTEDIGYENCHTYGHQGRHRAEIAADLGTSIPLMICYSPRDYVEGLGNLDDAKTWSKELEERDPKTTTRYEITRKYLKDHEPDNCSLDVMQPEKPERREELEYMRYKMRRKHGLE